MQVVADYQLIDEQGIFEIKTSQLVDILPQSTKTLAPRMLFPNSAAEVTLDASQLNDGDVAGFSAFQGAYAFVGLTKEAGKFYVVIKTKPVDKPDEQSFDTNELNELEWERIEIDHPVHTFKK